MLTWLKELFGFVEQDTEEVEECPEYDFDFCIFIGDGTTMYNMESVVSAEIDVEKSVISSSVHYSRKAYIRCLDASDLSLLEVAMGRGKVFLEMHVYESTGTTLVVKAGYIDSMRYQIVADSSEPAPRFDLTLGLCAPKGIQLDATTETI